MGRPQCVDRSPFSRPNRNLDGPDGERRTGHSDSSREGVGADGTHIGSTTQASLKNPTDLVTHASLKGHARLSPPRKYLINWCARRDSNSRPPGS